MRFWDELDKSYGAWPVRTDANHAEQKVSGWKIDLARVFQLEEAAAADDDEEDNDDPDREALRFWKRWNSIWPHVYGYFDDATLIPPMRYTDEPPIGTIYPCDTLQIFSVMVAGIGGGFQWPLCVFGLVAIRDTVDPNRNIIFQRSRFECQTLTEQDSYLVLIGPARTVVLSGPVTIEVYSLKKKTIEVYLKVKGPTELEDKTLCFLAEEILGLDPVRSYLFHRTCTSKFCTVEFTLGHISGSWPNGFQGQFAACTFHGCEDEGPVIGGRTRVNHKDITLLSFGDEKVHVIRDGVIELSRSVVSARVNSNLEVSVRAWQDDNNAVEVVASFVAKEAGRSCCTLNIGSCKLNVIVAWSLISDEPEPSSLRI